MNLTPVVRPRYRIGLPQPGTWREILNTDASLYGGSNQGNQGLVRTENYRVHNQPCSAEFMLPPLAVLAFAREQATAV